MINQTDAKETKVAIWFSRILRWTLGLLFIVVGFYYHDDSGSWIIMLFGAIFIFTGFLRPRRCIDDKCDI